MNMQTNIDDVREEIMRLESAPHFDAAAWSRVLADLSAACRVSALADAQRRMETARSNQLAVAMETISQIIPPALQNCFTRGMLARQMVLRGYEPKRTYQLDASEMIKREKASGRIAPTRYPNGRYYKVLRVEA